MQNKTTKQVLKIVMLGGGGVGKSCLTFRLVHDQYDEKYNPTIEDSYRKENFQVDGESMPIEILGTAGQVNDFCNNKSWPRIFINSIPKLATNFTLRFIYFSLDYHRIFTCR